ncbi:MAG: putative ABC transporter permease [Lachnospiraceae bacterium]|nr:putative ABC transporter permease [Lachnospiraceae bacterium]
MIYEIILYFFIYGFLGWCVEVAYAGVKEKRFINRGFLNGPICPIYGVGVMIVVHFLDTYKNNIILLFLASVIMVTVLEYITGLVLEQIFHNKWWDYSNRPWNIQGYVCLLFSLIWGMACVFIVKFIHPLLSIGVYYIPKILGIFVISVCITAMFADLYVTASAILKMNKRLAKMDEIAKELHRISEELGENIYREVSEAVEKGDAAVTKMKGAGQGFADRKQDVSDDLKSRIVELKKGYRDIVTKGTKVSQRLVAAFPKMQPQKYGEVFRDFKNQLRRK